MAHVLGDKKNRKGNRDQRLEQQRQRNNAAAIRDRKQQELDKNAPGSYQDYLDSPDMQDAIAKVEFFKKNGKYPSEGEMKAARSLVTPDIMNWYVDHQSNTQSGFNWVASAANAMNSDFDGASQANKILGPKIAKLMKDNPDMDAKNLKKLIKTLVKGEYGDGKGNIPKESMDAYWALQDHNSIMSRADRIPMVGDGSRPFGEKWDVFGGAIGANAIPMATGIKAVSIGAKYGNKAANWIKNLPTWKKVAIPMAGFPAYDGPYNIMDQHDRKGKGQQDSIKLGQLFNSSGFIGPDGKPSEYSRRDEDAGQQTPGFSGMGDTYKAVGGLIGNSIKGVFSSDKPEATSDKPEATRYLEWSHPDSPDYQDYLAQEAKNNNSHTFNIGE